MKFAIADQTERTIFLRDGKIDDEREFQSWLLLHKTHLLSIQADSAETTTTDFGGIISPDWRFVRIAWKALSATKFDPLTMLGVIIGVAAK